MKRLLIAILTAGSLLLPAGCAAPSPPSPAPSSDTVPTAESQPLPSGLPVIDRLLPLEDDTYSRSRQGAEVSHIMIHFMSNVVNRPEDPYRMEDAEANFLEYEVSSHYVIDREGKIVRFVPEERAAYHAGIGSLPGFPELDDNLNDHSVGIELLAMGSREEMAGYITGEAYDSLAPGIPGYTEAQYASLKALIREIAARHPGIRLDRQHVVGHDEYAPGRKQDPGELFDWSRLGLTA